VLDYFDRAVYRSSFRTQLDGSQPQVFSFSEVFDGNRDFLQQFVRKDIDTSDPGRVGGNRDVLDFPLFFAMRDNLSGNGLANDWRNVVNASQDAHDDGLANNGSQAVAFVGSHDEPGPYLSNVAHAYVLLRPGNAVVYFNAKEFGAGRDFPKDGRGDALGGLYGDVLTTLVGIRTSHGRGNYIERWLEKEMLIYEREGSALVVLSNRLDGGFDSRTVQTSFAPGTPLIELTGNADDPVVDPFNDFPELLVVQADGTVNLRVPRNTSPAGVEHGRGYLIYGPAPPQGSLVLEGVAQQIASDIPTPETNGTARLTPWDVITADQFTVRLDTVPVNLLGFHRDRPADGDNALLRLDEGRDLNSNGSVDFVTPGQVAYGFEQFTTLHQPGYLDPDGVGAYAQVIDATLLEEGPHFLTVRAFRHREPGEGEAIFADFKRALYVDRLPPQSAVASFAPLQQGVNENRRLEVRSLDLTADNVHVFLDLPAALSDAEILAMLGPDSQTARRDRDRFAKDVFGITSGNHVATVVTFEITGNYSIQRVPGLFTSTIFGAGLGDLDFDGDYDTADVSTFGDVLFSHNTQFNPAADFTADGLVDLADLTALGTRLGEVGAGQDALAAWQALVDSVTLQLTVDPSSLAEDAGAAAAAHFAGGAGQAGRAHVLDAHDRARAHRLQAGFEQQLFQERISHLHVGALLPAFFGKLGRCHRSPVYAVAARLGAHVDHRVVQAAGARQEDLVLLEDPQGEDVHQRVAVVAGFKHALAAHGRHAEAVTVVRDSADHALQNSLVARSGLRVIKRPEPQRVHYRDGPRAHGEDVPQDSPYARGRALERLDKAGMVVGLDLEGDGVAVSDVNDARVLSRALQDVFARGWELLQMQPRALVGAVLAPHDAEDAQLRVGGLAAQNREDLLVFFRRELVRLNNLRGDFAHDYLTAIEETMERNSTRPSVEPISGSLARSGWGISPSTLRSRFRIPAMSRSEPFGLST